MNNKLVIKLLLLVVIVILCVKRPVLFSSSSWFAVNSELADGVYGIDVSHDQGKVDWQQVADSGVQFVYLKATDGVTYHDPNYFDNLTAIKNTPLPVGAYHFFEAEDNPQQQLDNFLSHIKGKGLTLAPMVDVELTREQSAQQIQSRLHEFLIALEQQLGCKPLIYSNSSFWQANIGPSFNDYPFWFAHYGETMNAPEELKNIQIWQYSQTGTVAGISTLVDLDKVLAGKQALETLKCNY
ncbi:glycoside hydrolase family 25 protein [Pseudoalteromonas sp. T1lg23B]|uniref:glycoside hydrolase family 25 protein n=1 Tax=Pseudoalteromonas sp. T1lg23B TaxID=2077097 RepID=UPI000CF6BD69|nr:GH25 family lysozyme [Pseudoalteromonas sp. T1lg23B]